MITVSQCRQLRQAPLGNIMHGRTADARCSTLLAYLIKVQVAEFSQVNDHAPDGLLFSGASRLHHVEYHPFFGVPVLRVLRRRRQSRQRWPTKAVDVKGRCSCAYDIQKRSFGCMRSGPCCALSAAAAPAPWQQSRWAMHDRLYGHRMLSKCDRALRWFRATDEAAETCWLTLSTTTSSFASYGCAGRSTGQLSAR